MKKTRFLALALVVAIALMGAGYAFWTEALEITGTVDTGELRFEFVDPSFEGGEYVTGSVTVGRTDNEDLTSTNTLNFEFVNMHPGSTAEVGFCLENTGTIGLKLEDFIFDFDSPYFEQMIVVENGVEMGIEDFFRSLENLAMEQGDKLCKKVVFKVKECANELNFAEEVDFEFSVTATVKQYNDKGQCDEKEPDPDPEPEITGIFLENKDVSNACTKKNCKHRDCKDRNISAKVYYTWSEGKANTFVRTISGRVNNGTTVPFNIDDVYTVTVTNRNGNITWSH